MFAGRASESIRTTLICSIIKVLKNKIKIKSKSKQIELEHIENSFKYSKPVTLITLMSK